VHRACVLSVSFVVTPRTSSFAVAVATGAVSEAEDRGAAGRRRDLGCATNDVRHDAFSVSREKRRLFAGTPRGAAARTAAMESTRRTRGAARGHTRAEPSGVV
jgi:hypothetical protein